jgi:hypothetical protein
MSGIFAVCPWLFSIFEPCLRTGLFSDSKVKGKNVELWCFPMIPPEADLQYLLIVLPGIGIRENV